MKPEEIAILKGHPKYGRSITFYTDKPAKQFSKELLEGNLVERLQINKGYYSPELAKYLDFTSSVSDAEVRFTLPGGDDTIYRKDEIIVKMLNKIGRIALKYKKDISYIDEY